MTRNIELPDTVYGALEEAAREAGTTPADWIASRVAESRNGQGSRTKEDWIDRDFLKAYAREADDSISLEAVRKAMAKIPGCLANDVRAERDER